MGVVKVAAEDRAALAASMAPLDTEEVRDAYRRRDIPRAEAVRDIDKRYRWDLLRAAVGSRGICALYDKGCTDVHIDTALRRIVRPL